MYLCLSSNGKQACSAGVFTQAFSLVSLSSLSFSLLLCVTWCSARGAGLAVPRRPQPAHRCHSRQRPVQPLPLCLQLCPGEPVLPGWRDQHQDLLPQPGGPGRWDAALLSPFPPLTHHTCVLLYRKHLTMPQVCCRGDDCRACLGQPCLDALLKLRSTH